MGKRSESNKMEISSVAKKKKKKKRSRETEGTQKNSDLEVESPPHEKTTEAERKSHMDSQTKAKKRKRERKSHMTEPSPAAIKIPNPPSERRKVRKRTSLSICHLPPKLVGKKILGRVPITSLSAVRSTCTLWNSLSREWILGKAAARQQFLGFMSLDSKVCSVRFHLLDKDKGGLVDLSIKHVDVLGQVEVSKVYYCKGLLLCVLKDNYSSLVVWNPYLGQTRWIKPRVNFNFNMADTYALGYDKKSRSHKILRFLDIVSPIDAIPHEVYDFSSDSWRVLDVTPHWEITYYHRGASLKGNSYFFAQEKIVDETITLISQYENFLLCFDFTSERFGPPLALPFESYINDPVTLACVKEEQLAVLYQRSNILQIWVTTKIDPNSVSWSRFLKVDMFPLCGFRFYYEAASFFIDEEKKVAVVFEFDDDDDHKTTTRYNTAYIIGDDGYFKSVNLGKAQHPMSFPLVCSSSYLPSLVQITRKGTARDV